MPGLHPGTEGSAGDTSRTIEVDGETFALRANGFGGTDYTWLSGPDPGYGFGVSPTADLSPDEHARNIRGFLGMVDPGTGHIADD
ncbi:hypothetical protein [Micromonospora humida]|uniref:hypothetical protein n=1 Tax=Micromonospora humida TaxID=2809018 RepID=UPI00341807F6